MISRELFLSMATEEGNEAEQLCKYTAVVEAYEKLKNSIGSCGECKHLSKNIPDMTAYNLCTKFGYGVNISFFCADFKRKE